MFKLLILPLLCMAFLQGLTATPPPRKELHPGMAFVQIPATEARPPYWIQQTETTRAAWREIMGTEPWRRHDTFSRPGDGVPVAFISWLDVQAFLQRLNEADWDHVYRLPTEAEWEEACRAGSDQEPADLGKTAWYDGNAFLTTTDKFTHPVALKAPNAWGLHDCLGNVWEWVEDARSGKERILKGGSWRTSKAVTTSRERNWLDADQFAGDLGFRLVATPVEDGLWSEWAPLQDAPCRLSWRMRWLHSEPNGKATWCLNLRNGAAHPVEVDIQFGMRGTFLTEIQTLEGDRIKEINATLPRLHKGQRPTLNLLSCRPLPEP